jgi:hypothetical protein
MPKKPIDWSRCIIYKIYKDGVDDFYIGSTTDFIKRKYGHKTVSKTSDIKIYKIIRDNGGWDEWIMTAIEEYKECENQIQARIREEEWRVKLNATMNTIKAYLSIEEKKEYEKKYSKDYRKNNIDKIKEYDKNYRKNNINKIKDYQKEYSKEWYNNNIDKLKEYKKEYSKEYQKLTIYCDCCKKYINKTSKARHFKSKNHINNSSV